MAAPRVRPTRRDFLKTAAAAGVLASTPARAAEPAVKWFPRLNVGFVGVNRRGGADLDALADVPAVRVVALCDVDDKNLAKQAARFPEAKTYNDFRRMLDDGGKGLDAVVISTADHVHAAAAVMALRLDKHVYCEKPLAHSVYEARRVAEEAHKSAGVTQLGTQIHAGANYREVVEVIDAGVIGPVREVHVFVARSWSPADDPPPQPADVPAGLHWDLWLGPAPDRPYHGNLHPANWRKWYDFGNGTLGDMGCHYMDLAFWALRLRHPTKVSAEGAPAKYENAAPEWLEVRYEFPARKADENGLRGSDGPQRWWLPALPAVQLTWYDGGRKPPKLDEWGVTALKNPRTGKPENWDNGVVFVGDRGVLIADYNRHRLLPEKDFAALPKPTPLLPRSAGHHAEWVRACLRGEPEEVGCPFSYGGPLTEAVLLGAVAYRAGKAIEWDAKGLKAVNAPEAEKFVRREYRKGWEL